MGTYISDTAGEFLKRMTLVQKELEGLSAQIENRNLVVFQSLKEFEEHSRDLLSCPASQKNESEKTNDVEKALIRSFDMTKQMIQQWRHQIQINSKGTKFMHKNEKYLVVMVFGAVKTGKSTLGNFFAGRELKNAPFDNAYKHIEDPAFETEEKGRDTGDIEKDSHGCTWFSEGVTDTTGDIQYFTLSGLRWIDSPGTGALSREGDIRANMEEMVNEYIPYTDLCIFLMNSSEPGLQADFKYMDRLSREGQEALIVITKSDVNDEDIDEDGNLIERFCAKSKETRAMQENDICQRVHRAYPEINQDKFHAISISTRLAKEAIETNDEQKYKDSQLDLLMKILGEKASAEAVRLKERKPKQNLNHFIDKIIGDASRQDNTQSIFSLKSNLDGTLKRIEKYQKDIEAQKKSLTKTIYRKAEQKIELSVQQWARDVEKSGKAIDEKEMVQRLDDIVYQIESKEISQKLTEIIADYQHQEIEQAHLMLKDAGLQKETQEIKQEYTEIVYNRRDPCGLWEHLGSFFLDHTYYSKQKVQRTMTKKIDVGTNKDQFLQNVLPQINTAVQDHVQLALTQIGNTYFAPQEETIQKIYEEADQLEKKLNALKFEEA